MHEFSIVSSLLESCYKIAKENGAEKVFKVFVEIGERSGVDSKLLESAFAEFKIGSVCENAELFVKNVKIELKCDECGIVWNPIDLNYTKCVKCGGDKINIIEGNEMILKRLEME
ncbi:MAG: hydrogenase/urease nickel incorporation protein HypA [Helicobacteraceae bacterium]|nr:hydrogenase/urease nickel incorporation protein HypA [Helicobacteraceae bacterium]